ncbi:MAG: L,D-transpeptidase [Gammaproteobacteria bacterium]|nr:L,D-transpeptidase [Gammaproteobacteria bacterium]
MWFVRFLLLLGFIIMMPTLAFAQQRFGETLCAKAGYFCLKIQDHDTWENLFPTDEARDIVMRVNRMNIELQPGMTIAIPKRLDEISIYDVSPFPRYVEPTGEKMIYVNQAKLAWGAYNSDGELVWWGPISGGSGHCRSIDGTCRTPSGAFRVIRKQDIYCISTVFPVRSYGESGGAVMPYCMHFFRGYALHGSYTVPGYHDSHGCVRMFIEDAKWLNEEFITVPGTGDIGTRVIVNAVS